tara:strand:+ start:8323 stop:8904 length:582 start_codon:yes stop_codon:yes gene_type:complete
MAIIKQFKEKSCEIAVWKTQESLDEMTELSNSIHVSKFKTEKRKREFLSARILLSKLLPDVLISYNIHGAPELENDKFISISHSQDLTAIIIGQSKVGIDVEKIREKILRVSSKFIPKNTHKLISKEKATLIWCCKEAVYKWYQKGKVNFIEDIKIMPFTIQKKGSLIAKFKTKKLRLHYQKIDDHFLVYVCK